LYATAFNRVNNVTISRAIKITDKVRLQQLILSNRFIQPNEEVEIAVSVIDADGLYLKVDFGDGLSNSSVIAKSTATNKIVRRFKHV